MNETSKAYRRRVCEEAEGGFAWSEVFSGVGVDVGAGEDPLPFDACIAFDKTSGDANHLSQFIGPGSRDYLHASQCLEHMLNPREALTDWIRTVKPGGWLVITVPDLTLYEGMKYPSRFNPDHKSSWSLFFRKSPFPQHVYVPDFLAELKEVDVIILRLLDCNYDYSVGVSVDQTYPESDMVEPWIEFVLRKK